MSLSGLILEIAQENFENQPYFHGTRSMFPFKEFDPQADGTGIVSGMGGQKYGGFFFSSEQETAEYFTEWLVCKVKIKDINLYTENKNPNKMMEKANEDNKIYIVKDVTDGRYNSNIVVVPHSKIKNVEIIDWIFVGDKEFYFETLDEYFNLGGDDDLQITQHMVNSFMRQVEMDKDYILDTLPEFREYYDKL